MGTNRRLLVAALAALLGSVTRVEAQPSVLGPTVTGETPGAATFSSSTSLTASGGNRYLLCAVDISGFFVDAPPVHVSAAGVVFAGVPLHFVAAQETTVASGSSQTRVELWDLPLEGAVGGGASSTVTVSLNSSTAAALGCALYTSVNQTTPHGTIVANDYRGTSYFTLNIASAAGQIVAAFAGMTENSVGVGIVSDNPDQTEFLQIVSSVSSWRPHVEGASQAGATLVAMKWFAWDGSTVPAASWAGFGVPLIYDGSTPPVLGRGGLMLLGVGHP